MDETKIQDLLETSTRLLEECVQPVGHCTCCAEMTFMGRDRADALLERVKEAVHDNQELLAGLRKTRI